MFSQQQEREARGKINVLGEYVQLNRNSREGLPINKNKLTRRKKEKQKETGKSIQPDRQSRVGWPINTVFDPFFPSAILDGRPLQQFVPTKQQTDYILERILHWELQGTQ